MTRNRNITKETRSYVLQHPSIRDCLAMGMLNHSALARKICSDLNIKSFDAVLAAVKRVSFRGTDSTLDSRIRHMVRGAQVRVTNKIAVVVVEPGNFENILMLQKSVRKARGRFNMVDGDEVITLIISEQHLGLVRLTLKNTIRSVTENLSQINLVFDERLETTPGVVAYFYGLLAFNGINIREELSCWTDLILVVDDKDVPRVLQLLN